MKRRNPVDPYEALAAQLSGEAARQARPRKVKVAPAQPEPVRVVEAVRMEPELVPQPAVDPYEALAAQLAGGGRRRPLKVQPVTAEMVAPVLMPEPVASTAPMSAPTPASEMPSEYAERLANLKMKSETPLPQPKPERPVAAGEVSADDLEVVKLLQELQENKLELRLREATGLPLSEDQEDELEERLEEIEYELYERGFIKRNGSLNNRYANEVVKRVYNTIKRNASIAAYRMLRGRKDVDKQEIATDAAAASYMNITRFKGKSKLMTWVWANTRHLIIDVLERNKARGVTNLGTGGMTHSKDKPISREFLDKQLKEGMISEAAYGEALAIRAVVRADIMDVIEELQAEQVEHGPLFEEEIEALDEEQRQERLAEQRRAKAALEEAELKLAYAIEEDHIVRKALAKLSPEHRAVMEALTVRGVVQLADGTQIDVGEERPSNHVVGLLVGIPEKLAKSRLAKAREKLIANMERPVAPPYYGVLSSKLLVPLRKGIFNSQGQLEAVVNYNDPATIAEMTGHAPPPQRKTIRRKQSTTTPQLEPATPRTRERGQWVGHSSWVDVDAEYPIEMVLEGEEGVSAHLYSRPTDVETEVKRVYDRLPTAKGRMAYYSMGEYRNNPTPVTEFYFSDATDLWNMLQDGEITPEQYEVCLAVVEADLEA